MHLILPKTHPNLESLRHLPLFFLAGPILGGGDWQLPMAWLLRQKAGDCIIVNPSRYGIAHPLYANRMQGREDVFERQTDWERQYLRLAAETWPSGCIIFWLAAQKSARTDGRSYAEDTRGEIGEWRGQMMHRRGLRVAMGAEKDFSGLSQIVRNFETAIGREFKIYETMEEVVDRAIRLADPARSFSARVST